MQASSAVAVAPAPTVVLLKPNTYNEANGRKWVRGVPQALTVAEAMGYLDNPRFRVRGLQGVETFAGTYSTRPKANLDVMLDIQALVEDMKLPESSYKSDPSNYTAEGTPNWHAIKTILGYDVTAAEVAAVMAGWEPSAADEAQFEAESKKAALSQDMLSERGDLQVHEVRDAPPRPTRRGGLTIVKSRSDARRKKNEKLAGLNAKGAGIGTHSNVELIAQVGAEHADPSQAGAVGLDGGN